MKKLNIRKIINELNILKTIIYSIYYKNKIIIYRGMKMKISKNALVQFGEKIFLGKPYDNCNIANSTFLIGENSEFKTNSKVAIGTGTQITVASNAKLKIGSGFINRDTKIYCFNNIDIGNNVAISENVIIRDFDSHHLIENGKEKINIKPITIEDDVWIGMGVTILKGVHIGRGSVIGAGSVVTKSFPQKSLIAGVPAKIIKKDIEWKV